MELPHSADLKLKEDIEWLNITGNLGDFTQTESVYFKNKLEQNYSPKRPSAWVIVCSHANEVPSSIG